MMSVKFKNRSTYKRDMGLLKNELDTTRQSADVLVIEVTAPDESTFSVLMDRHNLYTLGF